MNGIATNLIDGIARSQAGDNSDPTGEVAMASGEPAAQENPQVRPEALATIEDLSNRIERLSRSIHAPTLLKELFCKTLDWRYVNEPMPQSVLPMAARDDISDAIIIAKCERMPLCYVRLAQSELTATAERKTLDRVSRGWPNVLVAFGNFGENQLDFCWKTLDGRIARISLDRSLFGAAELAQAIYSMRAFDLRTEEPAPELEVAERLERQLKKVSRRRRKRRGLDGTPFSREMGRHQLLSHEEEKRLRRQYLPGMKHSARDKLILANLRLVFSIAFRYRRGVLYWEDILQEGVIGLIKAADKFDPEKGFRFSTYATWWIMQCVTRSIAEYRRDVSTPPYVAERVHQFRIFLKDFIQDHGFAPSDVEIRDYFQLSDEESIIFRQVRAAWFGQRQLAGKVLYEDAPPIDEQFVREECKQTVSRVLNNRLDRRTVEVISRRFGLGTKDEETLEQIGQSMAVTRERIRQIEAKAMEILRHPKHKRELEPYVYP